MHSGVVLPVTHQQPFCRISASAWMVVESNLVRAANSHYELTGPLPPLAIPSTLQDSLMARLDRLARVKEVAQLGATLGRHFSYPMIEAISGIEMASIEPALTLWTNNQVNLPIWASVVGAT